MYSGIDTSPTRGRKYALCKPDLSCEDVFFETGAYPTMAACKSACTTGGRPAVIGYMRESIARDRSLPAGAYVREVLAEHERDLARDNPAAARIQALARGLKARRQADLARRAAALEPITMRPRLWKKDSRDWRASTVCIGARSHGRCDASRAPRGRRA
jgi:hypothetical protein